jgi:hypothetical protein
MMPVTHLGSVDDFEKCLEDGGTYKFEITADEMPQLVCEIRMFALLEVRDPQTQDLMKQDGTWARVVRRLAAANTAWIYRRTGLSTYEVTCIIPPPIDGA